MLECLLKLPDKCQPEGTAKLCSSTHNCMNTRPRHHLTDDGQQGVQGAVAQVQATVCTPVVLSHVVPSPPPSPGMGGASGGTYSTLGTKAVCATTLGDLPVTQLALRRGRLLDMYLRVQNLASTLTRSRETAC